MIRRRGIPRNFTFFLLLLLVLAIHFALLRSGLILRNRASADATAGQIARSFLVGLRFDLATACYLLAPFAILAHIPGIAFDVSKRHRRIFLGVFTALMAVLTFTCLAEFEFFHEFQTRYNQVALQYLDQPVTVGGMAWYGYPVVRYTLIWLAWSAVLSAAVWGLMRLTYRTESVKPHPAVEIGSIVALIAIFVLLMRGGFASEPLRWGDAYTTRSEFANQMSLNGLYTLGVTARNNLSGKNHSADWTRRMSLADARQITREMVVEADETLIDAGDRTLLRRDSETRQWLTLARPASGRKPNVVIVLMESFSARFVGAVGAPGGLTPSIDAIARDGVLFKRAFSSGTHTHQGVFSTMLGFPNLPGYEYLMENYSGNQPFSALPSILRREGYQTLFIYNGNLAWDNMEGFFRKQGVDRFVGGKDFGNEIAQDRVWGVSDKDMLDRANQEFERAHKSGPFFGFVLTLSNHAPFDVPQPLPFPPTTGHGELNKRLDAMRYADWAIGQFIEKARGLAYFKDTLFVFVGDHGFHVAPRLTDVNLQYHHVPMIFYAPELLSQRGVVSDIVANHVNLAPSILGLLEVDPAAAHWGRNVFETDHFTEDHFAVFKGSGGTRAVAMARGEQLMVIGDDGKPRLYRYDLGFPPSVQRLDGPEHATTHSGMQRQIEGYVQSALADLASHNAGPEPRALEALSTPMTDVR